MKKNLIHTLAASVMLAATAGLTVSCTDNSDNPGNPNYDNQWGAKKLMFDLGTIKVGAKLVEGGAYSMQYERYGETKTVTGTLSDFYIAPVEVTNKLWAAVMGSKPAGQNNDGDEYPVTMVNYYDIMKTDGFIAKLNAMLKDQLPAGKKFALPTEAQWEYAAQGGKKSKGYKFAGSNTLDDMAWHRGNSDNTTHPVAQKQPNELGLFDMTGNAWEWTRDNFVYFEELPANQGKDYCCKDESPYRVQRGGSGSSIESALGTTYRDWVPMESKTAKRGLRLVIVDEFADETLVAPIEAEKIKRFNVMNGSASCALPLVEVKGGEYYIGQTEVTNDLWYTVMGSTPEGQTKSGGFYPVSNVNYYDIVKKDGFLDKLNELVKEQLPEGKKLALPTEAQWQYAAMGGQKSKSYKYAGSNTLGDVAWYKDNANGTTHPVASKLPNELGIYDMTGNVWEWTRESYFGSESNAYRAVRGGGALTNDTQCSVTFSDCWHQTYKSIASGLRLALVDAFEEEELIVPTMAETIKNINVYGVDGVSGDVIRMIEVKGGDYYIGRNEVTNNLWYCVMGTKPSGQVNDGFMWPVTMVSYEDITKAGGFLDKLNELGADQLPAGKKFQLPTKEQWLLAAQGGQKSKGYTYAGSNTIGDVAWYKDNANGTTYPVASKLPNELGIYDMSGNVWEWTIDKEGNDKAYCGGGAFTSESDYCKVTSTWADDLTKGFNNAGFRLVLK